ncbi:MAG: nuclear transport factor 2 family protein [Acidimicrobiia bacterium]
MLDDVADRLEIHELTNRYGYYNDSRRLDDLLDLWTEDAVFDETAVGLERLEGRPAIRRFFDATTGAVRSRSHVMSNQVVLSLDGDHATGVCYFTADIVTSGGDELRAIGYYEDVYARVDGSWKIAHRTIVPLHQPRLDALARGVEDEHRKAGTGTA